MPSKQAKELALKVATAMGSAKGTDLGGAEGAFVKILAAQIDVGAELVSKGSKITPRQLAIALAQKQLSLTNAALASDMVQCAGSLASVGLALAAVAASVPAGPLGWAGSVLGGLAEVYGAASDCKRPLQAATQTAKNESLSIAARFRHEFWSWVEANGGMAPPR